MGSQVPPLEFRAGSTAPCLFFFFFGPGQVPSATDNPRVPKIGRLGTVTAPQVNLQNDS